MRSVRFFAQGRHKAGHVVALGNSAFGFDADKQTQGSVPLEFFEAGIHGDVTQGDAEQESTPQNGDGVVIASLAARLAQGSEELAIGDGFQDGADALQEAESSRASQGKRGLVMVMIIDNSATGDREGNGHPN